MATYPTDATITTTAFDTISTINFSSTGSATNFNVHPHTIEHVGEVVVTVDGIEQATSTYSVSNSGATITFVTAPSADSLSLKIITVPARFRTSRKAQTVKYIEYSNTATVVQANTYVINGVTQNFALPFQENVNSTDQLLVTVSGVEQASTQYVHPASNTSPAVTTQNVSLNLGNAGISIGTFEDTALLLNFETNFTDESPKAHGAATVTGAVLSDTKQFGNSAASFDGTNDLISFADSAEFKYEGSFCIECFARFEDASQANTVFSHRTDDNNFVKLSRLANNKMQWLVKESGSVVADVQGGSISADTFTHVAVAHNKETGNTALFVNGSVVQFDASSTYTINPTGAFEIGRINTTSADTREHLKGFIDSFRFVNNSPVRTGTFETPVVAATRIHTPLQSDDVLVIRRFTSDVDTFDRFTSMEDRKPDRGFSTNREFDVINFESQGGYEKRRLRSRRSKRDFDLTYTNITGVEKHAIEQFYIARNGSFETFTFDLTHINENGTIQARFDGSLQVSHVFSDSSNTSLQTNYYTVNFKLKEVYD
jgi:hypothetical protein